MKQEFTKSFLVLNVLKFIAFATLMVSFASVQAQSKKKANIIFILADDL